MNLYNQISNCTFDDIYVGDYIESSQTNSDGDKITWLIADINNYLYTGDGNTPLTRCHATIIPAQRLGVGRMNETNTTATGYGGSEMVTHQGTVTISNDDGTTSELDTLDSVLNKYVLKDFADEHILTYTTVLSTEVDSTLYSDRGRKEGATSTSGSFTRRIDLMDEMNVYGSVVFSSSYYDTGIDNRQYAIFQLRPDLMNTDGNGNRYWYWLKDVYRKDNFTGVFDFGHSANNGTGASRANGSIRPRFLIG